MRTIVESFRKLRPGPQSPQARLTAFVEHWRALTAFRPLPGSGPTQASVATLAPIIERLGPALKQARATGASVNIWQIAGLRRDERRNAEALAWLLDPRGSHGLGAEPLGAFFAALEERAPDLRAPEPLERAIVRTEHRPMNSERDRIDLVVEHPAMLLFLEIKIDAVPGDQQLQRYAEAAQKTATRLGCTRWHLAFLTVRRPSAVPSNVISLLWRDLAGALRRVTTSDGGDTHVGGSIRQLLNHFESF